MCGVHPAKNCNDHVLSLSHYNGIVPKYSLWLQLLVPGAGMMPHRLSQELEWQPEGQWTLGDSLEFFRESRRLRRVRSTLVMMLLLPLGSDITWGLVGRLPREKRHGWATGKN